MPPTVRHSVVRSLRVLLGSLAFVCAFAAPASAQNPFTIEGTVLDADNSGVAAVNPASCLAPSPQACKEADPSGTSKELGPKNGSSTKVGNIHTAAVTMLSLTNPNAQVDLNTIWTQTREAANGDLWFYFAWARDSNSGSGVISIELQQAASGCDYTSDATLLACNPWAARQAGDFILLWDQQGGARNIYIRRFSLVGANLVLGPPELLVDAAAQFSADGFRGEAAVNLTAAGIFTVDDCQTFAGTIPGTITGNSDTADYKDAVLAEFPPVTNCGTLTIRKVTDPADGLGDFDYKVDRVNGDPLRFPSDGGATELTGTLFRHSSGMPLAKLSETHADLVAGDDYRLEETALSAPWEFVQIECSIGGEPPTTLSNPGVFEVEASRTTVCTIHNRFVRAAPTLETVQAAVLHDSAVVKGIFAGAPDAGTATVKFTLFIDATCDTPVAGYQETITVNYNGAGTEAYASTLTGKGVNASATYYWLVEYSGDAFNEPASSCTENTIIVFNN